MQLVSANGAMLATSLKEREKWIPGGKKNKQKFNKWTGKKREEMYGNVLKFPTGTDHLGYFEKNPHPDKISDKDAYYYELYNKASGRENAANKKLVFELMKKELYPKLTKFERELLSLPDVLQEEINRSTDPG